MSGTEFNVTAELPVKPHIKKYLEVRFGDPAILQSNNIIGKYFYGLCGDTDNSDDKRIDLLNYKETATIRLTQRIFFRRGYVLTPTNIARFNNFVDDIIKENLQYFVIGAAGIGGVKKMKAYDAFMDASGLSYEVFAYETLKKYLDRSAFFKNTMSKAS